MPCPFAQVLNCKDGLAQAYLLECITQVFPVEYHVATLSTLLQHCGWLSPSADLEIVLINLMQRLGAHGCRPLASTFA
jgi:vacuolar protein sorting-associated protein 35